jgi:dTMP kinase
MPDLTIILDVPAQVGLARIITGREKGAGIDRIERQALEFHQSVRAGYLAIAAQQPSRCRVIDATQSFELVGQEVVGAVQKYLSR